MMGDRLRLRNFMKKFIGTVRFGNDHFGAIMGYGDYVIGDSVISRVYYVEGLGHNLFSVKFLRSKEETLEVIIKFLKQIQVGLNKTIRYIRTDNGIEFVNKDLTAYYERVSIFTKRQFQGQNRVVERWNRTLIEAARTMLIFSKASMFLWAKAVATAYVEPIPPHNRNNGEVHLHYLKHLKESVETLREIVEEAKELLEYAIGTCLKDFNQQDKKHAPTPLIRKKQVTFEEQCDTSNSNTHKHVKQLNSQKTNVPVPPSTGVNCCTNASGSQPRSNTKENRISPAKGVNKKKVEEHPRTNKSNLRTTNRVDSSSSSKRTVINSNSDSVCQTCNKCLIFANHDVCVVDYLQSVKASPSIHKIHNVVRKVKQVWKLKTVRFGNDHFGAIMGYEDYVIGDSVISRVYYVEGLGHNLFSVKYMKIRNASLKSVKPRVLAPGRKVEEAKVVRPLDRLIISACRYTKHSQELLEYAIGTCPKAFNQQDKKHAPSPLIRKKQVTFDEQRDTSNSNTHKHVEELNTQKTNVPVPPSTGVNYCTNASGSQPRSNTKTNRISPAKGVNKKKVE
ncbi:integrase, catalytic region, zinc finger, CCHC-type containing protein [Tanacetum coccineum]